MPTFLHTGDIHLDSAFSAHFDSDRAERRRNEALRCVSEIIRLAEGTDILLIAGDMFDSGRVSRNTVSYIKRKFAEIPNTHIFIAAGNHDPYTADSVYAREDLGGNVHVFGTEFECVELPDLKTRVFGVSFGAPTTDGRIAIPEIQKKDGIYDIMLLHADLASDSAYNPIDREFITNCGADYLALGHIHKRSEVLKYGNTYFSYCGIPEGRGFDECGDMGCYLCGFRDGVFTAEFKRTCIRRMFRLCVDVSGAEDTVHAAEAVREAMAETGGSSDLYRVILTGRVGRGVIKPSVIKEELAGSCEYLELRDETKPDFNIEKIAEEDSLCGEFVRRIRSMQGQNDEELINDALSLGLWALLGGDGE